MVDACITCPIACFLRADKIIEPMIFRDGLGKDPQFLLPISFNKSDVWNSNKVLLTDYNGDINLAKHCPLEVVEAELSKAIQVMAYKESKEVAQANLKESIKCPKLQNQFNQGVINIFASEHDVHFCVIDDQVTVDCYRIPSLLPRPAPLLSTKTS
uniref:Uncharacterized protein n=1 Tax=Romanomermis culicivorax TaxID=13658 RepID=A0A915J9F6_ROMCU